MDTTKTKLRQHLRIFGIEVHDETHLLRALEDGHDAQSGEHLGNWLSLHEAIAGRDHAVRSPLTGHQT